MVYVRGHPSDFDEWAVDAPGWSWRDVEPLFRRMEDWSGGADAHRGSGGPLSVYDTANDVHPMCQHFLQAASQLQIPFNADYNGASMEGASIYQITTKHGLRASAARCYLHPALSRSNLVLRKRAHATRIVIEQQQAKAVIYQHQGEQVTARARREVILCGGAINSPQLLQLSGIGPKDLLQTHGIAVEHDAPHVGRHLQDHLGADIVCRTHAPTLNQVLRPWHGKLRVGLEFLLQRRGPLTLSLNQAGGFVRSRPELQRPDLQLYFSPVSYPRAPPDTRPLISPDPFPGLLLGFNPCKPSSEGYLQIRSADPFAAPLLQPNYLSTEEDRNTMLAGMRLMRQFTDTPAMRSIIAQEVYPGDALSSDAQLQDFVKDNAWTVFHQCGTCRMGDDANKAVVDSRLRVHGIDGLRVADASIFPTIPTGNTNAPAIMVGEKAADLIRADSKM